jgi:hypothetical protein
VEVDAHYEPPASEAGACKLVQRATQWESARSGTENKSRRLTGPLRVLRRLESPTVSGRAFLPPSHIPTDGLLVGRTPGIARGPLFIFRKIHLYGKTKKSTHGHQTAKPFRTHFFFASSVDATEACESNATGPAGGRRL